MLFVLVGYPASAQFRSLPAQAPVKLQGIYTSDTNFTVPSGVKRLLIKAWGAGGGGGGAGLNGGTPIPGGNGGTGGFVSGIIPVDAGMLIEIYIGGGGAKGVQANNIGFGGSGGGDTYVLIDGTYAIVTGAGGGGGGADSISAAGGNGGNGGGNVADNGQPGLGTIGGDGAAINVSTGNGIAGGATNMPVCPGGTSRTQPSPGSSIGSGGICAVGGTSMVFAPNAFQGGGRYSMNAGSRPSGGGGAAGGMAFGGGGQGTTSDSLTPGSGAGGGGGRALVNKYAFPDLSNNINEKSAPYSLLPPISADGDRISGVGISGLGANILGPAGGNGGPGQVVIYFYYN